MRIVVVIAALLLAACDQLVGPPLDGPGAMVVLEIDKELLRERELRGLSSAIREELRRQRPMIFLPLGGRRVEGDHVTIKPANTADATAVMERIAVLGNSITTSGGADSIEVRYTDGHMREAASLASKAAVETVRRRLSAAGLRTVTIAEHGQIIVLIPGPPEPRAMASLLRLLTYSGDLSFNLVDPEATAEAQRDPALWPIGEEHNNRMALPDDSQNGASVVIFTDAIIRGGDVAGASQAYDQANQPSIVFQLKEDGKRRFAEATSENVGRSFAIVLDNRIVSAPNIRSPITGGSGTIEGGFTMERAEEMAMILRSGTLPAPLKLVERRLYETPPKID
jgi:protein-export membrane protein SecD